MSFSHRTLCDSELGGDEISAGMTLEKAVLKRGKTGVNLRAAIEK